MSHKVAQNFLKKYLIALSNNEPECYMSWEWGLWLEVQAKMFKTILSKKETCLLFDRL